MRSEGFLFYFGGLQLRRIRSTLLLCSQRPQPSAGVRSEGKMAVPMASSAKAVTFGDFNVA
jgi:hypothetical protein